MVTCTAEKEAEMNQLDCKNVQKTFAQLTQTLSTLKKNISSSSFSFPKFQKYPTYLIRSLLPCYKYHFVP
jgi:hypothetical protein